MGRPSLSADVTLQNQKGLARLLSGGVQQVLIANLCKSLTDAFGVELAPPSLGISRIRASRLLAPVRNARKTAGKPTAVSAGLVVSSHKDYLLGDAGAVRFRKLALRYKSATLPTPSSATGAMKAIVV
jgi:hypothetical protein